MSSFGYVQILGFNLLVSFDLGTAKITEIDYILMKPTL